MPSLPSIQTFYQKDRCGTNATPSHAGQWDDGFTQTELQALSPLSRQWTPTEEYKLALISNVLPGRRCVCFSGRVVNCKPAELDAKAQYSKAYHYLVVKDDTGAIAIKLMPLGIPSSELVLGQLVTVWATYIGEPPTGLVSVPFVTMCTPINPNPGTRQFIQFRQDSPETQLLYRTPLGIEATGAQVETLPGLMTLGAYLKTGHDDVRGVQILVCVRSVGVRKRIRPHGRQNHLELLEITVCDNTTSCGLTLWETQISSARAWKPNETILLITSPRRKTWRRGGTTTPLEAGLGMDHATLVDVDPKFPDAEWLRKWMSDRTKERVCIAFPEHIWNSRAALNGSGTTATFTIAEIDDLARIDPEAEFTGKLSLIILDMGLSELWFRKHFCHTECCGVPLYANSPFAVCKNCMSRRPLSINPRVVGTLADETGCISKGKLVWSPRAWGEFFCLDNGPGRVEQPMSRESSQTRSSFSSETEAMELWKRLTAGGNEEVGRIEGKVMYSRLTLTFGWSPKVGRLSVLRVEW